MIKLSNAAGMIAVTAILIFFIALEQPDENVKFWGVVVFIVLGIIAVALLSIDTSKTLDKMLVKDEIILIFTITYTSPSSGKQRIKRTRDFSFAMKLLAFLAKRKIKYTVNVEQANETDKRRVTPYI